MYLFSLKIRETVLLKIVAKKKKQEEKEKREGGIHRKWFLGKQVEMER